MKFKFIINILANTMWYNFGMKDVFFMEIIIINFTIKYE